VLFAHELETPEGKPPPVKVTPEALAAAYLMGVIADPYPTIWLLLAVVSVNSGIACTTNTQLPALCVHDVLQSSCAHRVKECVPMAVL
jgi:hypothetical protein